MKDDDTGQHVIRVGKYAAILAQGYGLSKKLVEMIEMTAPLHDIGKIGVCDNIMLKPGKLDTAEREIMQQHVKLGQKLIPSHDSPLIKMTNSIVCNHHERWDGTGYSRGLKGESIPIEGRITAIADVFDALTTKRSYKEAWSFNKAVDYISSEAGKAFDPNLVKVFCESLPKFEAVRNQFSD